MANTFIELNDTPSDYAGGESKFLRVDSDGNSVVFSDIVGTTGQVTVTDNNTDIVVNLVATGITASTYGNTTHVPVITIDSYGRISWVDEVEIVPLSGFIDEEGNLDLSMVTTMAFSEIKVAGQTTIVADKKHDDLVFEAGAGITITTIPSLDKIRFSADVSTALNESSINDLQDVNIGTPTTGQVLIYNEITGQFESGTPGSGDTLADLSGGVGINYDALNGVISLANTAVTAGTYGSTSAIPQLTVDNQGRITNITAQPPVNATAAKIERFKLNYTSSGDLANTSNSTGGITSINIDSATGGTVTITFVSDFAFPPASIMIYGYDYVNNVYVITPLETSMSLREVVAGGSSGSPTLFDGGDTVVVKLRLREAETGASRGSFGTVTHAWVQMVMY